MLLCCYCCCCDLEPSWNNDDGGDLSNCCTLAQWVRMWKKCNTDFWWLGDLQNESLLLRLQNITQVMIMVVCTRLVSCCCALENNNKNSWRGPSCIRLHRPVVVVMHYVLSFSWVIFQFLTHCETLCNCNTVGYYSAVKIGQKSNVCCTIYREIQWLHPVLHC